MSDDKEVTRAELEGLLWEWIKDRTHEDDQKIAVARLLHESISVRERMRSGAHNDARGPLAG